MASAWNVGTAGGLDASSSMAGSAVHSCCHGGATQVVLHGFRPDSVVAIGLLQHESCESCASCEAYRFQ